MKRIKLCTILGLVALSSALLLGCGDSKKSKVATTPNASPDSAVTQAPTKVPTKAPTKVPPTPTPTEIPLPFEEAWKYEIVQNGYYNACATWGEDGKLLALPEYKAGQNIYYNDCDEYYNNFMAVTNVYGDTQLSLDDEDAHSSDNSIKITSRKANTNGFAGFGLYFRSNNVLDIEKLQGKEITIGMWVFYNDSFALGVPDSLKFGVWSNLNPEHDEENEAKTEEPVYEETTDEMTSEEKDEIKKQNALLKENYERCVKEEATANKAGFYKLGTKNVDRENWTYIEVTTTVNTEAETPCIVLTTLGEKNNENVSYYNPFYIDDVYVKLNN